MTSLDLKRFYELHFERAYQIEEIVVSVSENGHVHAEVTLAKDSDSVVIRSDEEDLFRVLSGFQRTIDQAGRERLARIRDTSAYFNAVQELIDQDGSKTRKALQELQSGSSPLESGFWHRLDEALLKLLFERTTPDDPDLLWLRTNHFQILAFYLAQAKGITGPAREALARKSEAIKGLSSQTEAILLSAFFPQQGKLNSIAVYKRYRSCLPDTLEDHTERVAMQLAYLTDLGLMLKKAGTRQEQTRILYVLEAYRRSYELARPILDLLRVAIDLRGGAEPVRDVSDDTIITTLGSAGHAALVDAFDPRIRHCESHLATRIEQKRRVVQLTTREGMRRIPQEEIVFEEVVARMERLHGILFPALYYAFAAFDALLKLMLLRSSEYKLLLISNTTR